MRKAAFLCIVIMVTAVGTFVTISSSTAATFTPVNIENITNLRIQDKNVSYPKGEFLTRYAVPFYIPLTGDNAWGAGNGIGGGGGNDGIWNVTVNVGVANVKTIYTLANTDWGSNGENRFSVTANFDNGESLTWVYTDGEQLRDWNYESSHINNTNTNEVFKVSPPLPVFDSPTPDVLDMQTLFVPEPYHSLTLEALLFTDNRQTFVHSVFLAGVTLSDIGPVTNSLTPVPVPATLPLFTSAVASLGLMVQRHKRRRKSQGLHIDSNHKTHREE